MISWLIGTIETILAMLQGPVELTPEEVAALLKSLQVQEQPQ